MTVLFSKKCELGIQACLYLLINQDSMGITAIEISEKMKVPKEFVSKVLQSLVKSGIVGSKKGKNGGFYLIGNPSEIFLIQIVEAIDGLSAFENCVLGFAGCSVSEPCPVHNTWGRLRTEANDMLTKSSLEDFRKAIIRKVEELALT